MGQTTEDPQEPETTSADDNGEEAEGDEQEAEETAGE